MYNATKDENFRDLKNTAADAMGDAKEDIRETANRAGRKVRGFINTATDELSEAGEKVSKEIQDKPVQSAFIALGLGLVLGALLSR